MHVGHLSARWTIGMLVVLGAGVLFVAVVGLHRGGGATVANAPAATTTSTTLAPACGAVDQPLNTLAQDLTAALQQAKTGPVSTVQIATDTGNLRVVMNQYAGTPFASLVQPIITSMNSLLVDAQAGDPGNPGVSNGNRANEPQDFEAVVKATDNLLSYCGMQ